MHFSTYTIWNYLLFFRVLGLIAPALIKRQRIQTFYSIQSTQKQKQETSLAPATPCSTGYKVAPAETHQAAHHLSL
jgi:hypothetical protein